MTDEKRARGRPPKPVGERRRHNQTFRCTDALRAKLEARADENQRSISEEVEFRLLCDLEREESASARLQNPAKGVSDVLLKRIEQSVSLLEGFLGTDWPENPASKPAMAYVLHAIIADYIDAKDPTELSKSEQQSVERNLEAADQVIRVVTWAPEPVNRLIGAPMKASEIFEGRKRLAERLKSKQQDNVRQTVATAK